jgi:hypothetical protein
VRASGRRFVVPSSSGSSSLALSQGCTMRDLRLSQLCC